MYALLAGITALVGISPLLLKGKIPTALILGALTFLVTWPLYYFSMATTVLPMFGWIGAMVMVLWTICAAIDTTEGNISVLWIFPIGYILCLLGIWVFSWGLFRADDYSRLLGQVAEREWTNDIQPKDPRHMRMVSYENASYIAKKAVANAGAIGSQFDLNEESVTLQRVDNQLYYVLPFDFSGFSKWQSSPGAPGYIMVDAEDPERLPRYIELPKGGEIKYSPQAYLSYNLERHLRTHGYLGSGLCQARFELDDDHKPWWIVTMYKPTIGWSGEKITQVVTVNPTTGEIHPYSVDSAPAWIDRIVSAYFVENYIDWRGKYAGGWWNSVWGKKSLTEAETPVLINGSDSKAEWVVGITSTSLNDDSLIGLMYVDSRTGVATYYRTNGGATDTAILNAVNANQMVKFKHLHASTPQIYNVYNSIASVVPLLSENHAYQGVAIVSVLNPQDIAVGTDQREALRNYQTMLSRKGQQVALSNESHTKQITGIVDRIYHEASSNGIIHLFHIEGSPRIFTGSGSENIKLPLTQKGDTVTVSFIASGESTVPLTEFDNLSLPLDSSAQENEVAAASTAKLKAEQAASKAKSLAMRLQGLNPEQLEKIETLLDRK